MEKPGEDALPPGFPYQARRLVSGHVAHVPWLMVTGFTTLSFMPYLAISAS
jgi:hypothetical protein